MKTLIIGAKGMLGQELAKTFAGHDLILWDKDDIDITFPEMVSQKIKEIQPELIINSAAYNAVDDCEENFEFAQQINAQGPANLAQVAQEIDAIFVHFSTDYVFDGEKRIGYFETDQPNPISKYGESKMLGEKVLEFHEKTYLIRTSRLFGKPASSDGAKKSFVDQMIELSEKMSELKVVDEERGCPTYVPDLAQYVKDLLEGEYEFGLYHGTNQRTCTWYEFAQEIFKILQKDVIIKPVKSDHFPRPAKRPLESELLNTKGPKMRSWQEALRAYLKGEEKAETNMKGIVLAGGKGTRLHPLTKITSKQLLPIYNKAMVMYPVETLIRAGIKDILIIVAPEYAGDYLRLLGSGKELGVKFTYEIQDEPKGLPEAFIIGENFIGNDNVTLILGDNLFFDHDFAEDIKSFEKGGRIFAVQVPDPERFGVVEFDENKQVISIEEKPQQPKSNYAIPGLYIFDNRVINIAKGVRPTTRPETEIVDIHKAYLAMNELDVRLVDGLWLDTGTFEALLKASNVAAAREYQKNLGYNEKIFKT